MLEKVVKLLKRYLIHNALLEKTFTENQHLWRVSWFCYVHGGTPTGYRWPSLENDVQQLWTLNIEGVILMSGKVMGLNFSFENHLHLQCEASRLIYIA